MEWAILDEELNPYIDSLFTNVDTALYGRVTYQLMESYWPTVLTDPNASPRDLAHARWVDTISKIVFSRTLSSVEWRHTQLVKDRIAEEIAALKQEPGQDLMIFGSPRLTHAFMHLDLIDEYRLLLNPIVLGGGIPLFQDIFGGQRLKPLEAKAFQSGIVGLHYQSVKA